jgi:porin
VGKALNSYGISPSITFIQFWLANPSVGEATGQQQNMSLIDYGVELDMKKIAKVPGATLHFHELLVPLVHNTGTYGTDAADVFVGQPGPYIPYESHLTRFSWEQHLLGENRAVFEFGKSNAGDYYAIPVCNTNFGCESLLTQYEGGMGQSPAPYANFLGRIGFNFNKKASLQVAEYRETAQFPWTDGWEWGKSTIYQHGGLRTDSNVYMADFMYKSDASAKYPSSFEGLYYHNTAAQNHEFSTGTGFSNPQKDWHNGTNGMYASGRQTIYRFDGGRPGPPRSLTAFAQLNQSFDSKNVSGLTTDFKTGAFVSGLLKSRPIDSYGFNVWTAHLTNNYQSFLQQQYQATFGKPYTVGQTQFAIGPDANFIFKNVIVSPFALYTFNANSFMNPNFSGLPVPNPTGKIQNGWGVGATLVVLVDKVFGLGPAMF